MLDGDGVVQERVDDGLDVMGAPGADFGVVPVFSLRQKCAERFDLFANFRKAPKAIENVCDMVRNIPGLPSRRQRGQQPHLAVAFGIELADVLGFGAAVLLDQEVWPFAIASRVRGAIAVRCARVFAFFRKTILGENFPNTLG
jgi:hypothetical protein